MNDPRLARLAKPSSTTHSACARARSSGINSSADAAAPLILALQRVAIERGVHAYANVALEGLAEILVAEGSKAQREFVSELGLPRGRPARRRDHDLVGVEHQVVLARRSWRRAARSTAERSLVNRRWERIDRGEMRWVGTLMPTNAHAQDAEMSLREYEDFVFRACHVDGDDDPVAHWRSSADELTARAG